MRPARVRTQAGRTEMVSSEWVTVGEGSRRFAGLPTDAPLGANRLGITTTQHGDSMNDTHLKQLQAVFPGRTALRPREICKAFGFGLTHLYELFKRQQIHPLKAGKVTLVTLPELAAWMDRVAMTAGDGDVSR